MKKLLIALIAGAFTLPAVAQDGSDMNLADGWVVTPKAGMYDDFEEALKAHLERRVAAGDPREWHVYTPAVGDDLSYYVIRSCCFNWASFDDYETWNVENEMGDDWNANVDGFVDSYKHNISVLDFENSHWPEDAGPFKLFGVTHWNVKPGHGPKVRQARERMSQVAIENDWDGIWSWSNSMAGSGGLTLVIPHENYADMAPPEQTFAAFLAEQIGEEESQQVFSDFSSGLMNGHYTLYRHRPDLSVAHDN